MRCPRVFPKGKSFWLTPCSLRSSPFPRFRAEEPRPDRAAKSWIAGRPNDLARVHNTGNLSSGQADIAIWYHPSPQMTNQVVERRRPLLTMAVLCERILRESDNVVSLIRVVDKFTYTG